MNESLVIEDTEESLEELGAEADESQEELNVKRSTARGRMKSSRYQLPLNPYYVDGNGDYKLSLLGNYFEEKYLSSSLES